MLKNLPVYNSPCRRKSREPTSPSSFNKSIQGGKTIILSRDYYPKHELSLKTKKFAYYEFTNHLIICNTNLDLLENQHLRYSLLLPILRDATRSIKRASEEFRNDSIGRWKEREKIHAIVAAERFRVEAKERPWKTRGWASRGTHLLQLRNATNERATLSLSLSRRREKERERERARWLPATTRPAAHYSRSPRRATTIKTSSSSPLGWCMVSFTKRAVGRLRVQAFQPSF